ncbi:transcriptional regulator [Capnocytophaga granulosa]|uniref:transcriptional regulator n=1 Tax=Capnocytophaga granulosa TaxID=45242 RepID=UPI0023F30DC4|nr:transcriptional regulator [Capnocytophaga granulosa]
MRTIFKKGDTVLISPEVTHQIDWIEGTIIEIEYNPYVGIVLFVQTKDGDVFFERECLFRLVNEEELCLL